MTFDSDSDETTSEQADQDFARLVHAAQSGDRQAADQLGERYRDYLLLVANQELDAQLTAKLGPSDLVQQSLIAAHQHMQQFRGTTEVEFRRWLRAILLNGLKDVRRRFAQAGHRDVTRERRLGNVPPDQPLVDSLRTPGTSAAAREQAELVQQAMSELNPRHRRVIELRHWHDQSFSEIGAQMELSSDAARKLWFRAVTRLQQIIAQRYPFLDSRILHIDVPDDQ